MAAIEKNIKSLIVALCADYERRCECIEKRSVSYLVRMEYIYLNARILAGAGEIGGGDAMTFIKEIGSGTGYAYSELYDMSEVTYKKRKNEILINIGRKLHLLD